MIPARAHFIWFGTQMPWAHVLAIRSALEVGGFERAVLHHEDDLSGSPWWPLLEELPGFEARRLRPDEVLEASGEHGPGLCDLFARLSQPAARANMVRAAILAAEGGVYLDLDTVTVKSLDALRERAAVFCGEEYIALPEDVKTSRNPLVLARAGLQLGVRDVFRRLPGGWRGFRMVEGRYRRAVNNAVIGSAPGHPFMRELLERMVTLPRSRQLVRFALGTHLLQQAIAECERDDVEVHPPEVFYPLGPEISEHWFRLGVEPELGEVIRPSTRVVHWYASVRTRDIVPAIDPDYVRAHAGEQLFSALARRFVVEASP